MSAHQHTSHEAKTDANPKAPELSEEDRSKDGFFHAVAELSNAMIAAHGRDFAMGALILAARFIAENKAFTKSEQATTCCGGGCHDGHHHHS
ncbi:MAG: hypothetical protein ACRCS9_02945 [Hyphomicrobium sp.]